MDEIPGWLTIHESDELKRLAAGKVVLELGSYKGRSTVALAETASLVVSVDHHGPFANLIAGRAPQHYDEDTLTEYLSHVRHLPNVATLLSLFEVARLFRPDAFGLVFVDGVHDQASITADLDIAFSFDATIAAHDWGGHEFPLVAEALDLKPDYVVSSLAVWRA